MRLLKYKFRRGVFRCFQGWYRRNAHRFALQPRFLECRAEILTLTLAPIPAELLTVTFSRPQGHGMPLDASIWFCNDGVCVDSMGWFDAKPHKLGNGYVCEYCIDHQSVELYPSQESLWEAHVFEPLLQWINNVLASAIRIDYYRSGGATWVELVRSGHRTEDLLQPFHSFALAARPPV